MGRAARGVLGGLLVHHLTLAILALLGACDPVRGTDAGSEIVSPDAPSSNDTPSVVTAPDARASDAALPADCHVGAIEEPRGPIDLIGDGSSLPVISACGTVTASGRLDHDLVDMDGGNCLEVEADGVIVDGRGFEITVTDGFAVASVNHGDLEIRNVRSRTGGIQVRGCPRISVTHDDVESIWVYTSDDARVEDNRTGELHVEGLGADAIERAVVRRNHVESDVAKLVTFRGREEAPVPVVDMVIEDNTFISHHEGPADEPYLATIRFGTGWTVRNNFMRATGNAIGLYIRDGIRFGTFEHNTVWVNTAFDSWAAFFWSDGVASELVGEPGQNDVHWNLFRADGGSALEVRTSSGRNRIEHNVFVSHGSPYANRIRADGIEGSDEFVHNTFFGFGTDFGVNPISATRADWRGDHWMIFRDNITASESGVALSDFDSGLIEPDLIEGAGNLWDGELPTGVLAGWAASAGALGEASFLDAAAMDFRLARGSDALGRATDGDAAGALPAACTP